MSTPFTYSYYFYSMHNKRFYFNGEISDISNYIKDYTGIQLTKKTRKFKDATLTRVTLPNLPNKVYVLYVRRMKSELPYESESSITWIGKCDLDCPDTCDCYADSRYYTCFVEHKKSNIY